MDPQAIRDHLRAALDAIEPDPGPMLLELLDAYEAHHVPTLRPGTAKVYGTYGRWLRRAKTSDGHPFLETRIGELTTRDVSQAVAGPGRAAPRNRGRHVARIIDWAKQADMWSGPNPAAALKSYTAPSAGDPFDESELRALVDALLSPSVGPLWARRTLAFLSLVPWRPGEPLTLLAPDVKRSADGARCYLRDTKNGESQWREIPRHAVILIDRALNGRSTGYVFRPPGSSLPYARAAVLDTLRRACDRAGLRRRRTHDLRHSGATNLSARGLTVADVARALGHRSARSTIRYITANDGRVRAGLSAIANAVTLPEGSI